MKGVLRATGVLVVAVLGVVALAACDDEEGGIIPLVEGSVMGRVTIDGRPAPGITLTMSTGSVTRTGADGGYRMAHVAEGVHTVTISGYPADVSFAATSRAVAITTNGQVVDVEFAGRRVPGLAGSTVGGTPASGRAVDVLILGGNHYPVEQFVIAEPDNCDARHWHSREPVVSLEGTRIEADPNPTECGHGRVSDVPRASVPDPR